MTWKWWVKAPAPERNLAAEQMERARQAQMTLPVMREAYAEVREALMDQIVKSGPEDGAQREYFYHSVKGLDAVVAMVEAFARHGNMVEAMEAFSKKSENR